MRFAWRNVVIAAALFLSMFGLMYAPLTNAQNFQWPFAPFTAIPIVTQDYACRGTTNLINGTVDDVCFSPDSYHSAMDIKPTGSDDTVYAAGAGTVVLTLSSCVEGDAACNNGFGNWVIIEHGNNVYSLYSQLQQNSLTVSQGSVVTQGQAIATMGATGNVTGPHLNFAMGGIEAAPFLGAFQPGHPGAYGYYDPWSYISTASFTPAPVRVINAAGLNVRRGPGTNYSVFTEVSYNQAFVAFAKVGDWYRIHVPCETNSCAGWISAQSTHSVVDPSATQVQVIGIETTPLDVRSTPNSSSTALDKIYLNQKFAVSGNSQTISGSGCTNSWYPIYLPFVSNATSSWVCGDYLSVMTGATPVGTGTSSWIKLLDGAQDFHTIAIDPSNPNVVYAGTGRSGLAGDVAAFKSTNGGASWSAINTGLGNNPVTTFAIDPVNTGIVYAGTFAGGVYKTINGGSSWSAINAGLSGSSLKVHSLTLDPSNPNVIYVGTEAGVFKTINGGTSWSAANTGLSGYGLYVRTLTSDPTNPNVVYAGTEVGIFKSINGGSSWGTTGLTSGRCNALAINPNNSNIVYAGTSNGIYKSLDAGISWGPTNAGILDGSGNDIEVAAIAIDSTNPDVMYAGIFGSYNLYKTTNEGANWTLANAGLGLIVRDIAINPADPNLVFAASLSGIFKSADGGISWNISSLINNEVTNVVIDHENPNILYVGTRFAGINKTTDGGASWSATRLLSADGLYSWMNSINALVIDPSNPSILYAGTENNFEDGIGRIFKTINGGASWSEVAHVGDLSFPCTYHYHALAIGPTNPNIVYAGYGSGCVSGDGGITKTINGGASWTSIDLDSNNFSEYRFVNTLVIDPMNTNIVYAGTGHLPQGRVGALKTTDGGENWNAINSGFGDNPVYAFTIDPQNSDVIYANTYGGVFKTINAGASWTVSEILPYFSPSNPDVMYAWENGVIKKSTNGGLGWSSISTDFPSNTSVGYFVIDPTNPDIVYAATNRGVYKYGGSYSYSLQGTITKGGAALSGVAISVTGSGAGSVTSGVNGYNFSGLSPGSYAITPSLSGYIFDPPSHSVTISGFDLTGLDFRACDTSTPLTGTLRDATTNAPISGVNIIVDGTPRAPPTDANGNYSIAGLGCGTHTVSIQTPSGYQTYGTSTFDSYNGWNFNIQLTKNSTTQGLQTLAGYAADPVNTATGNYAYQRNDLILPNKGLPFVFERSYNSQAASDPAAVDGPLGYGWTHSYNASLSVDGSSNVTIHWGDGKTETFAAQGGGVYTPQYGVFDTLTAVGDGTFSLRKKDLTTYIFNIDGKLASITDKNGNSLTLAYTGGNLTRITDSVGRNIDFTYDVNNHLTQITDPLGRTLQYAYDGNGNLISATDRRGNATIYTYDGNHQILTVTDPRGNVIVSNSYDAAKRVVTYQTDAKGGATSYNYSELDRVTTITDALGNITVHYHDELLRLIKEVNARGFASEYVYDTAGNRVQVTDKNGNITRYEYDPKGNVTRKTDALGKITTITYDANNNPLTRTDALGNITSFTYDANSNLTRTTDALGNQVNITYEASGLPLTVADARGNLTSNTYDAQGNLVRVDAPLGSTTAYSYDLAGRRLTKTDALGRITSYSYDPNDNLLTLTDALGQVVSHVYDANNNRISETDRRGFSTSYTYDSKDLLETATDALNGVVTNGYDALDRKISVTDKRGNITVFAYDETGNLIRTTDAIGNITRFIYDPNGNRTAVIDPLNHASNFTYDALNRRVTVSDALSNTATTAYDDLGRVRTTTNAKGQSTNFTYDAIGRLIRVTDASGGQVQYGYDPNGNRISLADPNGNTVNYTYDALNRLISKTEPLGNVTNYQYDLVGNLVQATKPNGTIIQYAYDALNRLITVTYPDSSKVNFVYDANGNRVQMSDSTGTTSDQYDALNRVTRHTDPFGNVVDYGYDTNGNRTSLTYPGSKTVTYGYDALNRMTSVTDWLARTTNYSYDAAGRLVQAANPNGTSATYAHDNADRLTSLSNNHGGMVISSYAYTLDPIGNHTQETRDEPLLPVLAPGMVAYTYDAENRLTDAGGVANSFDPNGNMTARGADTFVYDFEDRLKQSAINGTVSQYQYDGTGNRLAKTVGADTTRYVLDLNGNLSKVLAETDATNTISAYYVHGFGLVSRVAPDGSAHYYHYDSRGSVVALTDAAGTITDKYAYDPFGKLANSQGSTPNPFKYVGRYGVMNEGNGLQYIRARYYDPEAGRFISKDPKAGNDNDGQSLNRYIYATNNPVRFVDMSGYSRSEVTDNKRRNMSLTSDVGHTFTLENAASYFEGLAYRSLEAAASELGADIFTEGTSKLLKEAYFKSSLSMKVGNVTTYSQAMKGVEGGLVVLDFVMEANNEFNRIGANWSDVWEGIGNFEEIVKFARENPEALAQGLDSAGAVTFNVATAGIFDVSGEQLRAGVAHSQEMYMRGINWAGEKLYDAATATKQWFKDRVLGR